MGASRDDDRGCERKTLTEATWSQSSGVHHKLYSESGVTFVEAVAPVPLDCAPYKADDLVLGEAGGVQHVAK